jgi:hypothetical protein
MKAVTWIGAADISRVRAAGEGEVVAMTVVRMSDNMAFPSEKRGGYDSRIGVPPGVGFRVRISAHGYRRVRLETPKRTQDWLSVMGWPGASSQAKPQGAYCFLPQPAARGTEPGTGPEDGNPHAPLSQIRSTHVLAKGAG